jgi:hypothetical protein
MAVAGLAAAVLFLVLTGIDSGLERLQAQGQPPYGMADLADGWFGATDDAKFALAAWKVYDPNDGPGYLGWGTWYVALDLAMVAAYMLALLGLFKRVGASPWAHLPLVVLVAAEVVEDIAQLVLVFGNPG